MQIVTLTFAIFVCIDGTVVKVPLVCTSLPPPPNIDRLDLSLDTRLSSKRISFGQALLKGPVALHWLMLGANSSQNLNWRLWKFKIWTEATVEGDSSEEQT